MAKPEFAKNPELFYPTDVFKEFGFSRHQCPKCSANYWRHCEQQDVCGDSNCVGTYKFIGRGTGIGRKGQKLTYGQAYQTFKQALTTVPISRCKLNLIKGER